MNTEKTGKFISLLRKEKELTQKQLADILGVTDKAVSRWETGKNYPDIELLEVISKTFNVTINELLEGKRISREELAGISENQVVEQIRSNKKSKKKYRVIIGVILVISLFFGYIVLKENGVFDGVIYNKIDYYSNEVSVILSNVEGYISQRPKVEGEYIINDGFFFLNEEKTTNNLQISGTCENGRYFYIQTLDGSTDGYCFIGEFRKEQEPLKGIPIKELKKLVAQIDLTAFATDEMYEISIMGIYDYNEENLYLNDYQAGIKKFIFKNGDLNEYNNKTIDGEYLLMTLHTISKGNGTTVAYIFCEV